MVDARGGYLYTSLPLGGVTISEIRHLYKQMRRALGVVFCIIAGVAAQAPSRSAGVVQKVDLAAKRLEWKTDAGETGSLDLTPETTFLRVKPGQRDLADAAPITASDLAVGDRVLVRGNPPRVLVMSQNDVAAKQARDRADWDRRGVMGTVKSVSGNSIVVSARGKETTVQVNDKTIVRRYAPDSVKFADAKVATIAEVKPGDQVRARGEKSADGATVTAEELVSGTFRNVAATISSIEGGVLKVQDLDAKKPLFVKLSPDTTLRKMPEMMARFMATRMQNPNGPMPGGPGAGGPPPGGAPPGAPPGGGPPGGMRGPGMGGGMGGGGGFGAMGGGPPDPARMIERLPAIKVEELKAGDAIIFAATVGAKSNEVTAITIIAGVEPILTAPSTNRQSFVGSWNLDMGGGMPMGQ